MAGAGFSSNVSGAGLLRPIQRADIDEAHAVEHIPYSTRQNQHSLPSELNCAIPIEPRKTAGSAGSCICVPFRDFDSTVQRFRHETRGKIAWSNDYAHELIPKRRWRHRCDVSIKEIKDSNTAPTR